jgi:RimJ/RimL family protein N-acetyltransferase
MVRTRIVETSEKDIDHILTLWNDGEVMTFVGLPNGLGITKEELLNKWLPNINVTHKRKHYSIYDDELGYCGEAYYGIDDSNKAALDIKLFPKARGRGIGFLGLSHAIKEAFEIGHADAVYVDPHKDNIKAHKLYEKLGFVMLEHPNPQYRDTHLYMELSNKKLEK